MENVLFVSEMRNKLAAYVKNGRHSQAQVARELNVSQTRLSQFLSDTYPGNNEALAKGIEQFFVIDSQKKTSTPLPVFNPEVRNSKRILQVVHMVRATNDVGLIVGPAGCGKTSTLRHHAENSTGVIYVEADGTMNTVRTVLLSIIDELKEDARGSNNALMRRIMDALRNTNRMIIIDEAQHLSPKALDTVRALNDRIGVSIIYAGNPKILKQLDGALKDDFGQLKSRIGGRCVLSNNYTENDIQAILAGRNISSDCIKRLRQVSCCAGGLRYMTKQYRKAADIATVLEQPLSVGHLDEAAQRMGIGGVA